MGRYSEEQFPGELDSIVSQLREQQARLDALRLDELKRRVMARTHPRDNGGFSTMKSRIATILAVLGIAAGTGGALAVANSGNGKGHGAAASSSQYKPGKGCGNPGQHSGPPGNPGNPPSTCPP